MQLRIAARDDLQWEEQARNSTEIEREQLRRNGAKSQARIVPSCSDAVLPLFQTHQEREPDAPRHSRSRRRVWDARAIETAQPAKPTYPGRPPAWLPIELRSPPRFFTIKRDPPDWKWVLFRWLTHAQTALR